MMNEDHAENGRINEHGEEEVDTTADVNSPTHSVTTPPDAGMPEMEYFDHKGGGSEASSEGGSPHTQERDNVSHHSQSYVTVSPPVSPGGWGGWVWFGK